MSQPFRLARGGSVDRSRPIVFTFDGLDYQGYAGDTLASALIANGMHLVGRSFKYHRPRGILSAGAEEPNALVNVTRGPGRSTPNLRATQIELYDGLKASSQNRWPSLKFDIGAVNDLLSPLFGAGFYYKTFMGPNLWAWTRVYEPMIRRAAGLGVPPREPDPDRYTRTLAPGPRASRRRWPQAKAARAWSSATKIRRWAARSSPRLRPRSMERAP
jgi:sarcosine oxidase subunit alpha